MFSRGIASSAKQVVQGIRVQKRFLVNVIPPQVANRKLLSPVSETQMSHKIESELIELYKNMPKGPQKHTNPKNPFSWYVNRYVDNAPGTVLLHAVVLAFFLSYTGEYLFGDERKCKFYFKSNTSVKEKYEFH